MTNKYLKMKDFLTKHRFQLQVVIETLLICLAILALSFSVFDLVDKFNIISNNQMSAKIVLVVLFAITLSALTIGMMLTLAGKQSIHLLMIDCFALMIICLLGYTGVLVPKITPSTLEQGVINLKGLLLGLVIIFLVVFIGATYLTISEVQKKVKTRKV